MSDFTLKKPLHNFIDFPMGGSAVTRNHLEKKSTANFNTVKIWLLFVGLNVDLKKKLQKKI